MKSRLARLTKQKFWAVLFVLFALSACTSFPPSPSLPPLANAIALPKAKEAPYFALSGRLSIRQNDRLDSVKIVWTKDPHEERLKFFSPFGSQLAELTKTIRDDGGFEVVLNNGSQITRADSIDALTESVLGVALEVDQIARWVQGIDLAENQVQDIRLHDGSVWQVTAERFQYLQNLYRYATRISAVKSGGDISLKLVVDEWRAQ